MKNRLRPLFRWLAIEKGWCTGIYRRFFMRGGTEYAEYLRRHGGLHSMGVDCKVSRGASIADPHLVRLGNNVSLSACAIIPHDGSIAVLNDAYNVKLDAV